MPPLPLDLPTRSALEKIGWTPLLVRRLMDAIDRESTTYERDMWLISIHAKPKMDVFGQRVYDPLRSAGCDCAHCIAATQNQSLTFLPLVAPSVDALGPNLQREAYTPTDFLLHSLQWNNDQVYAFLNA